MSFKPFPTDERWYAIAVLAALLGLDGVLVLWLMDRPVDGLSFLAALAVLGSLLVFVYIGFRTFGAFTLEYWVDRDAVTLKWGLTRQIVPLPLIQRVQIHTTAPPNSPPRILALAVPGTPAVQCVRRGCRQRVCDPPPDRANRVGN